MFLVFLPSRRPLWLLVGRFWCCVVLLTISVSTVAVCPVQFCCPCLCSCYLYRRQRCLALACRAWFFVVPVAAYAGRHTSGYSGWFSNYLASTSYSRALCSHRSKFRGCCSRYTSHYHFGSQSIAFSGQWPSRSVWLQPVNCINLHKHRAPHCTAEWTYCLVPILSSCTSPIFFVSCASLLVCHGVVFWFH
mgnify:FL=1